MERGRMAGLSWPEKLGRQRDLEGLRERKMQRKRWGDRREVERARKGRGKQRRKRGQKGETGPCGLGG